MTTKLELVTASSTDTLLKLKKGTAEAAIAWAGLNPAATIPRGKGVTNLYDRAALEQAVHGMQEAQKPVVKLETPAVDLTPISAAIDSHTELLASLTARVGMLVETVITVGEQLIAVQKQVNSFDDRALAALNDLGTLVDNRTTCLLHVLKDGDALIGVDPSKYVNLPTKRDEVETEVVLPKVVGRQMKVAIVGLLGGQKQLIQKEFGPEFDLRFFETTKAKSKQFESGVSQCDVAIGMVNFINHGVEPVIRNAGVPYVQIKGGMSSLRDKLTEMFAQEGKVAA